MNALISDRDMILGTHMQWLLCLEIGSAVLRVGDLFKIALRARDRRRA